MNTKHIPQAKIPGGDDAPEYVKQRRIFQSARDHAPDLLAMLERLLSRCKNLDQSSTHEGLQNCQSIADARALIAKIKGE